MELTGIHVEQRGVGTILREAKRNNDDWTMSAMIDTEKKVRQSGTRVEMRMETLSVDGKVSACAEQVGPIEKHRVAMVNLLQEWGSVLTTLTSEHQAKLMDKKKTNYVIFNSIDEKLNILIQTYHP